MYRLSATKRCELFELIAEDVWDSIVHNHRASVHKNEIGITSDIVSVIRNHHNLNPNFGVWSNPAVNEDVNGGDIDVFVETATNQFLWYALQAKVLKIGNKYERLVTKHQWTKLSRLKDMSGCIPFFLFYNGIDKQLTSITDCCGENVNEKQFGCAIVEINTVRSVALQRSEPRYRDFHPMHAHPWRELVCCTAKRQNGELYSLRQIQNAVTLYQGVVNVDLIYRDNSDEQINENALTRIRTSNESAGRVPTHSFAIRTTTGLLGQ